MKGKKYELCLKASIMTSSFLFPVLTATRTAFSVDMGSF